MLRIHEYDKCRWCMSRLGATLINSINWKAEKGDDIANTNF